MNYFLATGLLLPPLWPLFDGTSDPLAPAPQARTGQQEGDKNVDDKTVRDTQRRAVAGRATGRKELRCKITSGEISKGVTLVFGDTTADVLPIISDTGSFIS